MSSQEADILAFQRPGSDTTLEQWAEQDPELLEFVLDAAEEMQASMRKNMMHPTSILHSLFITGEKSIPQLSKELKRNPAHDVQPALAKLVTAGVVTVDKTQEPPVYSLNNAIGKRFRQPRI